MPATEPLQPPSAPPPPERSPRVAHVAALVLLSLPVIFYGLGSYSLISGDEGFYHYVARRMLATGEWTRIVFTGEHRVYDTFMNAPLQYWARAGVIALFGDSNWTMRLLSAVFALASVLMTYRFVLHVAGSRAGLLAGLAQLTSFQFVYMHSARTGELEPIVCFLFTLAAFQFLRAIERERSFLWHHATLLVLLNTKAPLVIVPVLAEGVFFAVTPSAWRHLWRWTRAWVILPLGLVWHGVQYLNLDEEARAVVARMGGQASGSEVARDTGLASNLGYYGRILLFGGFPWSLVYPFAVAGAFFGPFAGERGSDARRLRLLAVFPLTILAFFVVVAKFFPWYVDPMVPFLSALVGIWLERARERRGPVLVASLAAVAAGAVWIAVNDFDPIRERSLRLPDDLVVVRELGGLPPLLGAAATALVVALALASLRGPLGARFAPALARAATVGLVLAAGLRVLRPLQGVHYVSDLERLHDELAEKRARGEPIDFPVAVTDAGKARVRYYFGDEYDIVRLPDVRRERDGAFFELVGEGSTPHDPRRRRRER